MTQEIMRTGGNRHVLARGRVWEVDKEITASCDLSTIFETINDVNGKGLQPQMSFKIEV